jgi:protein-disulfide isomerase
MNRATTSRLVLAVLALPLALGVAACNKSGNDQKAGLSGQPVPTVAPPAGKAWTDIVTKTPEGGYLMGNPDAPIKLVEYGSLSCPHCAHLAQEGFQKLTGTYVASGRVSFEFRSFAIHPQDVPLTVLASCGSTEAFIPLAEQLYTNFDALAASTQAGAQKAEAAMSLPENQRFVAFADAVGYTDFFAARGISKDQAHACLADFSRASAIAKQSEEYGKDGIDSTPTLLINGSKIDGSTWADLEPALQRAGAR